MTNSLIRLGYTLVVSGVILGTPEPASASTKVLVSFYGSGFSGYLQYDQSQNKEHNYFFNFNGSTLTHQICYQYGTNPAVTASGKGSEPYGINTSGEVFQLQATAPANTTVIVSIGMNVAASPTALPDCESGTTAVFSQTGSFQVIDAITQKTIFSGSITSTSCAHSSNLMNCSCPPPPLNLAPQPPAGFAPPSPCYVYACPTPAPFPVYECQPRPSCCLSRLFRRGSVRIGCH